MLRYADLLFYIYLGAITAASGVSGVGLSMLSIGVKALCDFYRPRAHQTEPHPILSQGISDRFRQSVRSSFMPGTYPQTPRFVSSIVQSDPQRTTNRTNTLPPFIFTPATAHDHGISHSRNTFVKPMATTLKKLQPRILDLTDSTSTRKPIPSNNQYSVPSSPARRQPIYTNSVKGNQQSNVTSNFVRLNNNDITQTITNNNNNNQITVKPIIPTTTTSGVVPVLINNKPIQSSNIDTITEEVSVFHDNTFLVEELDSPRAQSTAHLLSTMNNGVYMSALPQSKLRRPTQLPSSSITTTVFKHSLKRNSPPRSHYRHSLRRNTVTRFTKPAPPRRGIGRTVTAPVIVTTTATAVPSSSVELTGGYTFKFDESTEMISAPNNIHNHRQQSMSHTTNILACLDPFSPLVTTKTNTVKTTTQTIGTSIPINSVNVYTTKNSSADPYGNIDLGFHLGMMTAAATAVESDPHSPFETQTM